VWLSVKFSLWLWGELIRCAIGFACKHEHDIKHTSLIKKSTKIFKKKKSFRHFSHSYNLQDNLIMANGIKNSKTFQEYEDQFH
jgi:hypothetical protein